MSHKLIMQTHICACEHGADTMLPVCSSDDPRGTQPLFQTNCESPALVDAHHKFRTGRV